MYSDHSANSTSLLRAYLIGMISVAMMFSLIAFSIGVYSSGILTRERILVSRLLPDLDSAYRLTAATAGLQSQGLLLRSSQSTEELEVQRQMLRRYSLQAQQSIAALGASDLSLKAGIDESISEVTRIAQRLAEIKRQQIDDQQYLDRDTLKIIDMLSELETYVQQQVVRLTEALLDNNLKLANISARDDADANKLSQFEQHVVEYDSMNLAIQDYLLFVQDLVSLNAIIEQVPLLTDRDSVTVAEQRRDLLLSALVSRSIYMVDADNTGSLLLSLRNIRRFLVGEQSPFTLRRDILVQENTQIALGQLLRERTNAVLDQTEKLRNESRTIVSMQAQETLDVLTQYRTFLLYISVLILLVLAAMSYWLLYRRTVLPLVQITRQLDDVGTERFPAQDQSYFLTEMVKLSYAMRQLDTAQKAILAKDERLQAVNRDLKRANEELEQFAHIASHDLQEPLRKLQQFSDLLEEDYHEKLDDDGRFFLDTIRKSAKRMSVLITETLAYSRAGSRNQSIEPVDLAVLLLQLRDEMELAIHEAQADIRIGDLPEVNANALGMAQLFRNLILNSLKYRKPDTPSKIVITTRVLSDGKPPSVCIEVADNGVGIDEKHLQRIFLPFERMHSGKVQGTGLGLAICRKVCDAHNWTLHVKSKVQVGTTFEIHIPASCIV